MDNLENLSLKELRALRNRVDQAIESFEDRRRREALSAAEQVLREHGFSLSDLTGGKSSRKGAKAAPKYANPNDPSQTWSGRGRRPAWVIEHLEAGNGLDDLAI